MLSKGRFNRSIYKQCSRVRKLTYCHRYCLSHTQPGGLGGLQDPLPCLHTTSSWCFHTSCLIIVLFRSSVRTTRAHTKSSSYVVCFILYFSYAQLVGFSVSTWRITTVATHIYSCCLHLLQKGGTENELLLISLPSTLIHC